MKVILMAIFGLLLMQSSAYASQKIMGIINGTENSSITVKDSNDQLVTLKNGSIELTFQNSGLISFFTGHRQIVLAQGEQVLTVELTSPEFKSFSSFQTLGEGNPIVLIGEEIQKFLSTTNNELTRQCTYAGYCYSCAPGYGINTGDYTCSVKFSNSCKGEETFIGKIDSFEINAQILVFDSSGRRLLATITTEPNQKDIVSVLQLTSKCK